MKKRNPRRTISDIYDEVLRDIKERGIKVYHRRQASGTGGTYCPITTNIEIDPHFRGTKNGVFILLHEYSHWRQHRNGEFKWFFSSSGSEPMTEKKMEEIFIAEKDASTQALRLLKQYGIFGYKPDELNPKQHKWLREFYEKNYFV